MDGYVPISKRTPAELRAKAREMRRMADTASTVDVLAALLRLAERYESAAAERTAAALRGAGITRPAGCAD